MLFWEMPPPDDYAATVATAWRVSDIHNATAPHSPIPIPQPPFLNLQLKVYVGDDADDRYRHRKELMAAHITGTPPPVAWDPKALRRLASKVPS